MSWFEKGSGNDSFASCIGVLSSLINSAACICLVETDCTTCALPEGGAPLRLVSVIIGTVLLISPSPAKAESVARWQPFIAEASLRFGIPQSWIKPAMYPESAGQMMLNERPTRSHAGAMGLMQVMSAIWLQLTKAHRLGDNRDDPRANILVRTAHLRAMFDRFGYPGLCAAYNAGPGRYKAYARPKGLAF